MKVALLLPGYLDSPDYLHLLTFEKRLNELGYTVEKIDLCDLWKTGDVHQYSVTNALQHIKERVQYYNNHHPEEIVLIGHSMGAFIAILAGSQMQEVTKIVALCPPPDKKESITKWGEHGVRISKRDLPDDPSTYRQFAVPYSFIQDALKYSAVDAVKNVNVPVMIFIALEDSVVPPQRTEQIVAQANQPYVIRQPSMGHNFRSSQEECNIVMSEIEKFLGQ